MALDACLAKIALHFSLSFKATGKVHSSCINKTFDFFPSHYAQNVALFNTIEARRPFIE